MKRLRFSMKSLLLAVVACALLTVGGKKLYEWYTAIPTVPLAQAVAAFNAKAQEGLPGKLEPPVTETEIVSAILTHLPTLSASQQAKLIYAEIARTRELPPGARLESTGAVGRRDGRLYTVWWINLNVMTSKTKGYGLRVRANDNPKAKPKDEPPLPPAT